ncbi:hypothetical protein B0181_04205 [Moraxella caviae]|uniref:Uncharacterized protein n=1 Tax=Moraxella caviae TaxID=34060 RepID=A0A1T0A558_9GAMM|nr:hypothetical protein B0181_04205 [Moraxella caviae]
MPKISAQTVKFLSTFVRLCLALAVNRLGKFDWQIDLKIRLKSWLGKLAWKVGLESWLGKLAWKVGLESWLGN